MDTAGTKRARTLSDTRAQLLAMTLTDAGAPQLQLRTRSVGALGLAEVSLVGALPHASKRLVLVLDKSGSMEGQRQANALAGLRALLQLSVATATVQTVVVMAFDDHATTAFGPGTPAEALAAWSTHIVPALGACGGTDIADALESALEAADGPATILLLTDGEDSLLARSWESSAVVRRLRALPSGVALHLVGICAEADAVLLGKLAAAANGTFVCIRDADIQGLMGSLLGLVMEQLPWACRLDGKAVVVRAGTPTLVPFSSTNIELCAYAPGLTPGQDAPTLTFAVSGEAGVSDEDVVMAHVRAWRGTAASAIAEHLQRGRTASARAALRAVADRLQPLAADYAGVRQVLVELAEEELTAEAAEENDVLMRELSARAASEASTARNSGVSIGGGSEESAGQRSMRSLSMAY